MDDISIGSPKVNLVSVENQPSFISVEGHNKLEILINTSELINVSSSPKVSLVSVSNTPQTISNKESSKLLTIFRGERGDPGTSYTKCLEILNPEQTVWNLSKVPINPELSELYLNGQKQIFLQDYLINGSILNWLGLTLSYNDYLEINYQCP